LNKEEKNDDNTDEENKKKSQQKLKNLKKSNPAEDVHDRRRGKHQEQAPADVLHSPLRHHLGQRRAPRDRQRRRDAVPADSAEDDADRVGRRRERDRREEGLVAPLGGEHEQKSRQEQARGRARAELVDLFGGLFFFLCGGLLGASGRGERLDAEDDEQRRREQVVKGDGPSAGHELVKRVQGPAQAHGDDRHDGERAEGAREDEPLGPARREQEGDEEGLVPELGEEDEEEAGDGTLGEGVVSDDALDVFCFGFGSRWLWWEEREREKRERTEEKRGKASRRADRRSN